jgi:hypothetical protein
VPGSIKFALILPFFMIITTLLMFVFIVRNISNHHYSFMSRFIYLLLSLISVVALWQLNYWNLLGFNY